MDDFGLVHFSPAELASNSSPVIDWLHKSGALKVMVHFDRDVMDPSDILAAVADGPEGGNFIKLRLNNPIQRNEAVS